MARSTRTAPAAHEEDHPQAPTTITAAEAVVAALEAGGVDVALGIPGVHTLEIYHALSRSTHLRHYLVRHEQGAGFAADGYARVAGKPAVCVTTTGPGSYNALAALSEAYLDSVPILMLAGQIASEHIGRDKGILHETADQAAIFDQVTVYQARPRRPEAIAPAVVEALAAMAAGRLRPAYVEMPWDLMDKPVPFQTWPGVRRERAHPQAEAVVSAARRLSSARRPIILAGGGAVISRAQAELTRLAERLDAPVLTTIPGIGGISGEHRLFGGTFMARLTPVRRLIEDADLALVVGCKLDAAATAGWMLQLPALIHLDIDPAVIGRNYPAEITLIGDARAGLGDILDELGGVLTPPPAAMPRASTPDWGPAAAAKARRGIEAELTADRRPALAMTKALRAALPRETIVVNDACAMNGWAALFLPMYEAGTWLFSYGSSALGYAMPAAFGASMAAPDRPTLALIGDGGVQFTISELAVAAQYGFNTIVLVQNDSAYGAIAAYQDAVHGERFETALQNPDFVALARSYGIPARRVVRLADLAAVVGRAARAGGPHLIDLVAPLPAVWDMKAPS